MVVGNAPTAIMKALMKSGRITSLQVSLLGTMLHNGALQMNRHTRSNKYEDGFTWFSKEIRRQVCTLAIIVLWVHCVAYMHDLVKEADCEAKPRAYTSSPT